MIEKTRLNEKNLGTVALLRFDIKVADERWCELEYEFEGFACEAVNSSG